MLARMWREIAKIPYRVGDVPIFGVGVLLAIVVAVAAISLGIAVRRHGWTQQSFATLPFFVILSAIVIVLPYTFDEGIPIRGYGVMLLVAIVAGVGLAIYRAKQVGLDPEVILALALWFLVFGFTGARLFYVIE
jgi:phosphatidylglycerol---prolipoprotein diacylglyceryl transferase